MSSTRLTILPNGYLMRIFESCIVHHVMVGSQYDAVFAPFKLAGLTLRNRIASTAHQTGLVESCLPTRRFGDYHEARARGGVGLIVLEATAVHPTGLLTSDSLSARAEGAIDAFSAVTERVKRHGTAIFAQLLHPGREQIMNPPRKAAVAPSSVPTERYHTEPRALSLWEIDEIIDGYAASARTLAQSGIDGIEISAAHRYLIAQFFADDVNQRDDGGGDAARILRRIVDAVREAAPGLVLGVRLTAGSLEAPIIASLLPDADYLSVTFGDASTLLGAVGIVPPPPFPSDALASASQPYRDDRPLLGTGRIVELAQADQLVHSGRLDLVGMTRALIADPELPTKARKGREASTVRCIGCNVCIAHYHAGDPIACAVNPHAGRESSFPPLRDLRRMRVTIIGAGPAGLAAAKAALDAGARIELFERQGRVGGQIAIASQAPGQIELSERLLSNFTETLSAPSLHLNLHREATVDQIVAMAPDLVIVASGARPRLPTFAPSSLPVISAWDALVGAEVGEEVVVADWGGDPSGVDAADLLAASGHTVSLVVASHAVAESLHPYRRALYMARLHRAGVRILHHYRLRTTDASGVELENIYEPTLRRRLTADTLVVALGREPNGSLLEPLALAGLHVLGVGDCIGPRSIEEALLEGSLAARRPLDSSLPAPYSPAHA